MNNLNVVSMITSPSELRPSLHSVSPGRSFIGVLNDSKTKRNSRLASDIKEGGGITGERTTPTPSPSPLTDQTNFQDGNNLLSGGCNTILQTRNTSDYNDITICQNFSSNVLITG